MNDTPIPMQQNIMNHRSNFDILNEDTLFHLLQSVGTKSFATFGCINRKCNSIFNIANLEKQTYFGYLPLLTIEKMYNSHRETFYDRAIAESVVTFNRRDLLDWSIQQQHMEILSSICCTSAEVGRLDILDTIFTNLDNEMQEILKESPRMNSCATLAAENGNMAVLRFLYQYGCPWDSEACAKAAETGNFEMLMWLHEHDCPWDEVTFHHAVSKGSLDVIQCLYLCGCPWDETTCSVAAEMGRLDILRWLRGHGCPWDEITSAYAANAGDLEMLKWLYENGCPLDKRAYFFATHNSHYEVLKFLFVHGCWDPRAFVYAAMDGDLDMMKFLHGNQCCPWNQKAIVHAIRKSSSMSKRRKSELLQWVRDNSGNSN